MNDKTERPPSLLALSSFLTASVAKGLRATAQDALAVEELDTPLFGVLVALQDFDVLSQQQLADCLEADKSHVVRLLDQLEKRSLVTRTPDPGDRRRHRIELTRTGAALARRVSASVADAEGEYLAAMSKADRRALTELLQKVLASQDGAGAPGR